MSHQIASDSSLNESDEQDQENIEAQEQEKIEDQNAEDMWEA